MHEDGKITGIAELFNATIGFQLGGQVISEIIFFSTKFVSYFIWIFFIQVTFYNVEIIPGKNE